MLVVVYGLAFLAGLMLNGSAIFVAFRRTERAIDLVWPLNLAAADFIFISFLPLRVWSMSPGFNILLTLSSGITAVHMVSRAFFLAAMTACCTISVASPAWSEKPRALQWAFTATVVIWALSFVFSVQYHDLWEAAMLPKYPEIALDEWVTMRPLATSFLIWFLCLLTLVMICYSAHRSEQKRSHHAPSRELIKRPFIFLLTFSLFWLPYHILYFLLVMWLDSPAMSSPGFISGCQVALLLPYFRCCCDAIICLSTIQESGSRLQQQDGQQAPRQERTGVKLRQQLHLQGTCARLLFNCELRQTWLDAATPPASFRKVMKIISMVIYSITLVLGTTGNGLVIFLTGFLMKKTVTTVWYLNLAVADFVFALSLFSEIAYLALDYHWTLGRLMCKLDSVVTFLNMFASVFFLTAISADRCVSVMFPVWALNHRTLKLASLVAGCIWTAALALSFPYLSFRDTKHLPDGSIRCIYNFGSEDDSDLRTQRHFSVVMTEFTVGFVIPFTIILACYCAIISKLRRSLFSRSSRSFKIIVAVVQVFFWSWFPYHLFSILEILGEDSLRMEKTLDIGAPLAHGLFCLNSCLNPLLYTFIGTGCKAANGQSFSSSFKGAFSENWFPHTLSSSRNSSSTSAVESTMV
ncbi:UNVERIFIED_CONTAM: hypothetical protein K2H54_024678 [Gekko kuhli]